MFLNRKSSAPSVGAPNTVPATSVDWCAPVQSDAVSSIRNAGAVQYYPVSCQKSTKTSSSSSPNYHDYSANWKPVSLRTSCTTVTALNEDTPSSTIMDRSSQQGDDGDTHDSAISGLSILNDETDEFYQQSMKQLARDQRRLRDATHGQPVKAFRRARTQPNAIEILAESEHRLKNNETDNDFVRPRRNSAQGPPSRQNERPLSPNVPKEWGRKGKQRNDYLRRINSTGDMKDPQEETEKPDLDRIFPRRTLYTGDSPTEYKNDTTTLSSTEQGSPVLSRRQRFPGSRLSWSATSRTRRTVDDVLELERREVEAQDNRSKSEGRASRDQSRKFSDSRQQQEIDDIRDRAVTTSRLARVGHRSLNGTNSLAQAFRRTDGDHDDALYLALDETENFQKSVEDDVWKRSTTEAAPLVEYNLDVNARQQQTNHGRHDSGNLLKQLARVSSLSPSPQRPQDTISETSAANQLRSKSSPEINQVTKMRSSSIRSLHSAPDKSQSNPSPSNLAQADLQQLPESRPNSIKSRINNEINESKTPRATGAWVETPRVHGSKRCDFASEPAIKTSNHPRSALEAALKHASEARLSRNSSVNDGSNTSQQQQTLLDATDELGDNTLASLGAMALNDPTELAGLDSDMREALAVAMKSEAEDVAVKSIGGEGNAAVLVSEESSAILESKETPTKEDEPRAILASNQLQNEKKQALQKRHPPSTRKLKAGVVKRFVANVSTFLTNRFLISFPLKPIIPTQEEEAYLRARLFEDLARKYLHPDSDAYRDVDAQTTARWKALYKSAQQRTHSAAARCRRQPPPKPPTTPPQPVTHVLIHDLVPQSKTHICAACGSTIPPPLSSRLPSLSSVLRASLDALHSLHEPVSLRPSARGYLILALLTWLIIEESLCTVYCHPNAREYFPPWAIWDLGQEAPSPWKPFVTYELLLRGPLGRVGAVWEAVWFNLVAMPVFMMVVFVDGWILGGILRDVWLRRAGTW